MYATKIRTLLKQYRFRRVSILERKWSTVRTRRPSSDTRVITQTRREVCGALPIKWRGGGRRNFSAKSQLFAARAGRGPSISPPPAAGLRFGRTHLGRNSIKPVFIFAGASRLASTSTCAARRRDPSRLGVADKAHFCTRISAINSTGREEDL